MDSFSYALKNFIKDLKSKVVLCMCDNYDLTFSDPLSYCIQENSFRSYLLKFLELYSEYYLDTLNQVSSF